MVNPRTPTAQHTYLVDQNHDNIGGRTTAHGIEISWFNPKDPRDIDGDQKGALVEDVIQAAIDRLDFLDRPEGGSENAGALRSLREALQLLDARAARKAQEREAAAQAGPLRQD